MESLDTLEGAAQAEFCLRVKAERRIEVLEPLAAAVERDVLHGNASLDLEEVWERYERTLA